MSLWDYVFSAEFWKAFGAGVGGTAMAVTLLSIFGKAWLLRRIEGSVNDVYKAKEQQRQAEYNTALETHKTSLAKEMEGWKAGYQRALDENRVRFSRLHADRADAIKQLFTRLVLAEEAVGAFVSPLRMAGQDEDKLREDARNAFNEFAKFFTYNRIFFTRGDCELIEKMREVAKTAYIDFTTYDDAPAILEPGSVRERRELQMKAYKSMTQEFQALRKRLENEFRTAMGLISPEAEEKGN